MKNIASKAATVLARAWKMPPVHKFILMGIVTIALLVGIDVEPATIDAIGTILMIANEVFAQ